MFEEDIFLDGVVRGVDEILDCSSLIRGMSEDIGEHGDRILEKLDDNGINEG